MQSAPVQHPFMLELQTLFQNTCMDSFIAADGKTISPLYQFANIINKKDMYNSSGHVTVKSILDNASYKSALDKYGIYDFTTKRKAIVPAMTVIGMREFMCKMKGDFADRFRAYEHCISTLVEANDPLINNFMQGNAASSNVYLAQSRNAVAQERAAAGASIAAPPEQVLVARMVCFCCT